MRSTLTSLIQIASAGAAIYGLYLAWAPLAWIAGGALGLYAGHELDR